MKHMLQSMGSGRPFMLDPIHLATSTSIVTMWCIRNVVPSRTWRNVTTVTSCNPHPHIPETAAPFLSPQAQSRNLTIIPDSEHPFPITLNHSWPDRAQPDRLYLPLVSSSSLSLTSPHTLPLSLSRSLRLTLLVLCLRQHQQTQENSIVTIVDIDFIEKL